jgi:flagellar hook assembly protein FlgD
VQIYNRWGQLVFESTEPDFIWDGKNTKGNEVSEGAYFVILNGVYGGKDVTRHYPIHVFRKK